MAGVVSVDARPETVGQQPPLEAFCVLNLPELQAGEMAASVCGFESRRKFCGQRLKATLDALRHLAKVRGALADEFELGQRHKRRKRG